MWHRYLNGSWSEWQWLDDGFISAPAAASPGPGRIDLFGLGEDQQVYHRAYDENEWGGWQTTWGLLKGDGQVFSTAPFALSRKPGNLEVTCQADTGEVFQWATGDPGGEWYGPRSLGYPFAGRSNTSSYPEASTYLQASVYPVPTESQPGMWFTPVASDAESSAPAAVQPSTSTSTDINAARQESPITFTALHVLIWALLTVW